MTRPLVSVDPAHPASVRMGLSLALSGGAAIIPTAGPAPTEVVPQKVALVVETSGSTGRPKRVMLSSDALLASAAASDTVLGGPGQWMLALPAHYIAGINVLVRSIAADITPVYLDPTAFSAERFVTAARELEHPHRLVSLVPAQLARLLESPEAVEVLRGFAHVLVGGQSMPHTLGERAHDLAIPVIRTYGSSETSGGCVYDGVPIGDTRLRITDGRVEIAGSVLAEGYLDDPRRTTFAFRDEGGDRWYRTDDAGELVNGVLRVLGRLDDVIVSGGVKVALSAVEEIVRSMPGLEAAVVVAAPHPVWGESPVVVTVVAVDREVVRDAVAARLGRPAAPSRILLVDQVPLLPSGKPDRLAIAALALGG